MIGEKDTNNFVSFLPQKSKHISGVIVSLDSCTKTSNSISIDRATNAGQSFMGDKPKEHCSERP